MASDITCPPHTTNPFASAAVVAVTAVTPVKFVFMAMIAPTGKMPRPVVLPVKLLSPEKMLFPEWVLVPEKVVDSELVELKEIVKAVPDFETVIWLVVPSIDLNDATPALVKAITSSVSAWEVGRVMS